MTIAERPLFSIGVPTYNRRDLLKQTLLSILDQTYTNFEVIVGNDFTSETLSCEALGIDDSRVRIINHKQNMGELENMNFLLSMAHGKYFTWQFDDDPCAPTFLNSVHSALMKFGFPPSVFTSYCGIYGTDIHKFKINSSVQPMLLSGRDFLKTYLSGGLKTMGCCGCYDLEYLKSIGGVRRLTNGLVALHSEYLLVIQAGLLSRVAYVDSPLVSTRVHEGSWTCSNDAAELFKQAGVGLVRESVAVLSNDILKDDFHGNLVSVLRSVISSVVVKDVTGNGCYNKRSIREYISRLEEEFLPLKGTPLYNQALQALSESCKGMPLFVVKAKLKSVIPLRHLRYVHTVKRFISRFSKKPF
jgi:glycosyltransferase involved in cell wall biosynthesis